MGPVFLQFFGAPRGTPIGPIASGLAFGKEFWKCAKVCERDYPMIWDYGNDPTLGNDHSVSIPVSTFMIRGMIKMLFFRLMAVCLLQTLVRNLSGALYIMILLVVVQNYLFCLFYASEATSCLLRRCIQSSKLM